MIRSLQGPVLWALRLTLIVSLGACDSEPAAVEPEPLGNLEVEVATTGEDLDPDGYTLRVFPDLGTRSVGIDGQVRWEDVPPGTYTVKIEDRQYNCLPERPEGWTATIVAEATDRLALNVSCKRQRWEVRQLASIGGVQVDFVTPEIGRAVIRGENPGFYWTTDGGESWDSRTITAAGDQGGMLTFPTASFGLLGGQGCTLLRTTDAGETWTRPRVCDGDSPRWLLSSFFFDDLVGWVGGGGGLLFHTEDGGETWQRHDLDDARYFMPVTGIHFLDRETGLFVGSDGAGAVYRTVDAGATWERQETSAEAHLEEISFVDESVGVAVGEAGTVIRTTDGGRSWASVDVPYDNNLWGVQLTSDGFGVAAGENGLVLVTRDGGLTWSREPVDFEETLATVRILSSTNVWISGTHGTLVQRVRD